MSSENLLRYVWDTQILPQAGYSFSRLHAVGYSLIALQEMNLAHRYPQLYWNTACLSVNAGADDNNDDNKGTNYGKVATAIGNMTQRGINVSLPYINKADFGFTPNIEKNEIVFGLKGINGINDETVHLIIENRPYQSFDDFIVRMYETKLIKKSQMTQLIKAGCFDEFGDRTEIMKQFIKLICEPKEKLTMQNLPAIIENNLIPEELKAYERIFNFRKYVIKQVYKTIDKPKDKLLLLDDIAQPFFNEHFTDECVVDYVNGKVVISDKKFKKEYDKKMETLKEWVQTNEALNLLNNQLFENEWLNSADGTISKWEMDSLSYYYHDHELSHVNKAKYGIVNFLELPEEPIKGTPYKYRGRDMFEYEISRLIGTVLDKDKNKHTVTLLTPDGVVTIKTYAGAFGHYNKQISQTVGDKKEVLEKSWFTRGNLLLISGFRRGNQFVCKTYKNSIYQHTICLIDGIDQEGNLSLTTERVQV